MTTRPLDPTEVYYELVDRLWPMNALGYLELEGRYDEAEVAAAWSTITDRVPVVGARVERSGPRDAVLDFGARLAAPPSTYPDVATMLADVGGSRIPLSGPLVRCATSPGTVGGTAFAVTAHHVALDGRPMAQLLFLLARVLDGADIEGHPLTRPTEPLGRYALSDRDWGGRRREMLDTARRIRDEEEYVGNGDVPDWYAKDLDAPRDLVYTVFELDADQSNRLVAWSKGQGATVHGALTAATVRAVAALAPGMKRVPLSTTVDLRVRAAAPAVDVVGQSAAVVSASFDASQEAGALARAATADIRRRVDRGEPELFFALSGVERLPVGEATDRVVRQWMEAAVPAANLSNLGVVSGDVPDTVRRVCVALAPTPNQVLFVAATTFRGRVTVISSFDRNRLSIDPETFTDTLRDELTALA